MKKLFIAVLTILALSLISGCAKEEAVAKQDTSIESLQAETGIPVRITGIEMSEVTKWDEYSGTLSGFEEISVFGLLGDNYAQVNVSVGDIVKIGDILAEFPANNPQANYNQARIGFETVEKTYERMKRVYESGGISQQQLDEVEAQYKIAKANFEATKQLVKVISPASGVVVDVFFHKGDKNDPQKPLCKIIKTNKLKATVFIEEEKISGYKKGQQVIVRWDGLKGADFSGTINKISMSSNPMARGFSVEILIENEKEELMPGIFVYVLTPVYSKTDAIAIPRDSFFKEGGKEFVYIAKDGSALKTEITTGENIGNTVVVNSGLNDGDRLISEGRSLLTDGAKIRIVE
jgi:membrane fusion protein, multidrug efflux system